MNQLELIGWVATEYLKRHLRIDHLEEGIARFLLDRLTGEQVAAICKKILEDGYLYSNVAIKVPRRLVDGFGLPEEIITDEKTTFWRNTSCDKLAIIFANTNDDQGQSLKDITTIGAGDLKSQPDIWVHVASKGLPLTDEQKKYWQQALKGLQSASECSLEQFSQYIVMVREIINEHGVPLPRALGWAFPALRIPRDSYYFDSIPQKALGHAHRWKKMYQEAFTKRGCYLYKQYPNRQIIENSDIQASFDKVKSQIDPSNWPIIQSYIDAAIGWTSASEGLAELEWESDKVNLLFSEIRPMKVNLAEKTKQFYEDEYPDTLTEEEVSYLTNLSEIINKRKISEATEEDKEFYERHRQELENNRLLKSEWDRFVYGKAIECEDFLVGLLEACERLFSQCDNVFGEKRLKIRTQKTGSKKSWMELNEEVGMYFCCAYRGLERLTNSTIEWDTHWLFKYDKLVEWRQKNGERKNTSTAKSAVQIGFYIELSYLDSQGNRQKNDVKLIWHGDPNAIGSELYDDLQRLCEHPFSYSKVSKNPVSKKGKLQGLSLRDVGTLQAVYGRDRGSFVGAYDKATDLQNIILDNINSALEAGRLTKQNYDTIIAKWNDFANAYHRAIQDWVNEGLCAESLIVQCEAYDELLQVLAKLALGDMNRIQIWHPIMNIGNIQVEGNQPISIITPWHPMRMAAKAVKARQVAGLINYILTSDRVDFGDSRLFFSDLKTEMLHPYYPEVAIGFKGQQPFLLSVSDSHNDYSLMEYPIRDEQELETNEDPKEASSKLLGLVERYLQLQPHEKTNLSLVLFNCDSTRLPEAIVDALSSLHDTEEEVRCQVILRHRDNRKLGDLYTKMVESTDDDPDSFVASEVTRDFMARLRVGVMADAAPITDPKDGKFADIVFLQDVISRQAEIVWDQVQFKQMPKLLEHFPPRWAKRRSIARDELKSTVYLTCPSQPSVGWSYLAFVYSIVTGKDPDADRFYLPARQISFQNEKVRSIFDEAHKLGEWVVNYDELLERRQLKNLGVKVIKYQHNRSQGSNLIVSSKSHLNLLQVLVKRRLAALNLDLTDSEIIILAEKFIEEANSISGDIVLRAAKRGIFAGELIGVVLSKAILQSDMGPSPNIGWFFLDDYAAWLGQNEEQIADILALCPVIKNGEPCLQVLISEAKYIDAKAVTEARKTSQKQLRDTVSRMYNAIFGNPGRLDRDLWLSRISDMLNDGIESSPGSSFSVERWREDIRNGAIPIEIRGYSHVFLSSLPDISLESERVPVPNVKNCYQELYTRERVRELVIAFHKGESLIPIREKLDIDKPWNSFQAMLPAERVNFVQASSNEQLNKMSVYEAAEVAEMDNATELNGNNDELDVQEESSSIVQVIDFSSSDQSYFNWANPMLSSWIRKYSMPVESNSEEQSWVNETVNKLRMALISYNLQAKVLGYRLTPNAIVVRLKGTDQIKLEDIEKRKSLLLTTHALDVISIIAHPGEIIVSLARPQRKTISLTEVWKRRKVQNNESRMNLSFVIGVKEIDGDLLYLNLGGEFEGLSQHAPHTLIAGATGSGKSVLLQNLILDICATNDKKMAHIYLIDPKYGVDYQQIENLPHLVEGIIDNQQRATEVLEELVKEMDRRYQKFREVKVNNLRDYNTKVTEHDKLPLLFLIHDEFAEWMLVDQYKSAVSSMVQRLGVKARAAGIHLIFAAQRPDANVLPVQLRDNLGNRLILRVESPGTSEIALGEKGAEKLLGKGHLLARLQGEPSLIYAQVPYLTSEELTTVTNLIRE